MNSTPAAGCNAVITYTYIAVISVGRSEFQEMRYAPIEKQTKPAPYNWIGKFGYTAVTDHRSTEIYNYKIYDKKWTYTIYI